jgi:hypothetical protein
MASRSNVTLTLVSAVAPSTFLPVTGLVLPGLLDLQPLSQYIEAIVSFVDHWGWTRIGLIRDDTPYYHYAAELLHKKPSGTTRTIPPGLTVTNIGGNVCSVMRQVKEYGTQIFILSMGGETALLVLEEVGRLGYSWPEYAWIVFSIDITDIGGYPKGVFLIHDCTQISFNHFLNISFGVNLEKFREGKHLNTVSITQLTDTSEGELEIAQYNSTLKQLIITYNLTASGNIPDGRTVVLEYHNSKIGIAVVVIVFVAILTFITIILIAYVYFRDEPEIKATSFSVSLCMFLGCYLMLLFVPFLLMESLPDGQLGLSGALICVVKNEHCN